MRRNFLPFFIIILFIAIAFFLLNRIGPKHIVSDIKEVQIANQNILVDLALTPTEEEQGLSGRPSLGDNQGMLFVFGEPGKYAFWMKDMNFPIDMIWFGSNMKVVYIAKDATPESYPETFGPGENDDDASYVLEVVAGFADKNNLKVGDTVRFIY